LFIVAEFGEQLQQVGADWRAEAPTGVGDVVAYRPAIGMEALQGGLEQWLQLVVMGWVTAGHGESLVLFAGGW
jgi:hypothetical protein